MSDIVKRLREGCIYYERNKLFVVDDDATDNLLSNAADVIERQREALRVAREALMPFAEMQTSDAWSTHKVHVENAKNALATIDAALKKGGE